MGILGYQITIPVLLSLLLSAAGFLLGVRFAKERADRHMLRDLYRELYDHFRRLSDALDAGLPKSWRNYSTDGPTVQRLDKEGKLSVLPSHLRRQFIESERRALMRGHHFRDHLENQLIPHARLYIENRVNDPKSGIDGYPHLPINFGKLVIYPEDSFTGIKRRLENENIGLGIDFALDHGKTHCVYVFPDKIRESTRVTDILDGFRAEIETDTEALQRAKELQAVEIDLQEILRLLRARIQEPTPLYDTLRNIGRELDLRKNK